MTCARIGWRLLAICAFVLGLTAMAAPASAQTGQVKGKVVDANNKPVEGAKVTIDDPKTYTKPFKVAFPIAQEPGYQNFEYACHEGNHAMFNSLSGARAQDQAEAAGRK